MEGLVSVYSTEIEVDSFPELRRAVTQNLVASYKDLYLHAYQTVTPRHWGSFKVDIVISQMLELSFDAISRGVYHDLFSWAKKIMETRSENDPFSNLIIFLKNEIAKICNQVIIIPSPLLGEISMHLTDLERIVSQVNASKYRGFEVIGHNAIDVEVDRIISSLNGKDFATGEHSRAVSYWCNQLGQMLGLSDDAVIKVTRGGLIHDIGKVMIPIEILSAPRRLTDEERPIMESHVTIGDEMIEKIPILRGFRSIIRHHHERLDGRGYPDKLSGDEIPLEVRIVTVADCYNAMIGRRPYRPAMPDMAAMEEINRHRSTQFDDDVVDAMFAVAEKIKRSLLERQNAA